ncbi:protein phosphatase 2C domain-containing protein [Streptomyces sp. NBC_01546]
MAPAPPSAAVPPPRDPRQQDATGYALGGVDVPPVRAPEPPPELPVWRWEVPRAETPERPAEAAPPPGRARARAGAARRRAARGAPPRRPRPHLRSRARRAPARRPGRPGRADPRHGPGGRPLRHLHPACRLPARGLRPVPRRGPPRLPPHRPVRRRRRRPGPGGPRRRRPGRPRAAEAAAELCRTVAAAVGRSQERLADDIRAGRRDALRSGLQRLTDRGYGRLRARAAELGLAEEAYTAGLRGLLLPVDPECRTRVCFGSGAGGLFRLRSGEWRDLEPVEERSADPRRPAEPGEPADPADGGFRFRASVAHPGDTLLLCSGGLAEPMREEPVLPAELAARWAEPEPPGLAAFLADTQLRLKGYADDRTAAAVWEA